MASELDPQEDAFFPDNEPAVGGDPESPELFSQDSSVSQSAEEVAVREAAAAPTEAAFAADSSDVSFSEPPSVDDAQSEASAGDAATADDAATTVPEAEPNTGFKVSPLAFTPPRYEDGRRMISFAGAAPESRPSHAAGVPPQEGDNSAGPASPSSSVPQRTAGAGGNPRLQPTADGGPSLARPIVLVSLQTEVVNAAIESAVKAATDRDTKTLYGIAEAKVELAFFKYQAERRVLYR